MSERPLSRRALLAAVPVVAAGLAGCAAPASDPAALAGRLVTAWQAGDRQGFVAALGSEAVRGAALWGSWRALGAVRLEAAGPVVRVHWRVDGERRDAVDEFLVADAPGVRLEPVGRRPVWFDEALGVVADGGATLLTTPGLSDAARSAWLRAASDAVARLGRAALSPWLQAWDGTLVVVVPADALAFARTTGLREGLEQTAAVTLHDAPDAAPRVVLNPVVLGLRASEASGLLVHEGVHAVTGSSARWSAPQWLAEGLAEAVACAGDADRAARNLALARGSGGGVPAIDARAAPDEAEYARAHLAYEASVARWGRPVVHGWLVDWASAHPTEAELGDAYRDRLLSPP